MNYDSFRLLDESKEITIKVIGDGKKVENIYINGIEDYFIFMDSQIEIKKYKELKTTDLSIDSEEIKKCIDNNWSTDVEFGTRENIFQDYYVYFDEGIKVRRINGKIYNVVFTNKYEKSVVNGFTVGEKSGIIKRELGTPTFESEEYGIIGYKGNQIYVFFSNDEISIYRNTEEDGYDEFFKLTDKLIDNEYDLLEYMNELTYLWPDYEEYTYDEDTIFLSYPNKGIDVKLNYENVDGIVLYNNIAVDEEKVNKYLEHTEFVANRKIDNISNAEKRRVKKEKDWAANCKEFKEKFEQDDDRNRGKIYDYYASLDASENIQSMYFISKDSNYLNSEINENVSSYIWTNDYCIIYSKVGKGIYYYDMLNQKKGTIETGKKTFELNSYKDGVLKYDDDNEIEFSI